MKWISVDVTVRMYMTRNAIPIPAATLQTKSTIFFDLLVSLLIGQKPLLVQHFYYSCGKRIEISDMREIQKILRQQDVFLVSWPNSNSVEVFLDITLRFRKQFLEALD